MEKLAYYWKRLRQNRLAYNLVLIGAIILAMAVAAHIVMQVGTRHGARRTVPDFSGVKLDQAQRMARKYDLKLHINDSLFVPAYEGGIVLDQLPEGGVEVKPGRTVYITINSFRQKMVPVPYVAGRSLRQAKNMLEIAGLEIDELVYRADMATNYVLDEYCDGRPVAATSKIEAELGSGVTLYVGVEGGYGTTVVPRLVGFPLKEAKGRLWELGLNGRQGGFRRRDQPPEPEGCPCLYPASHGRAERRSGLARRPQADARREETRPTSRHSRKTGEGGGRGASAIRTRTCGFAGSGGVRTGGGRHRRGTAGRRACSSRKRRRIFRLMADERYIEEDPELDQGSEATEEDGEGAGLYEHFAVVADKGQTPLRLDKFLTVRMEKCSRNRIQAAADCGNILVNGKPAKSSYKVKPLDRIQIVMPYPRREVEIIPEDIPLEIPYEDDDLLIVNKPAGLVVHPGHGNYSGTLVNALTYHLRNLPLFQEGDMRAGLVHRIDKNTSGLLVVAKNEQAHARLAKQFFDHTIQRRYVALVWGNFDQDEGTITGNIGRSPRDRQKMFVFEDGSDGKHAVTHWRVLKRYGYVTLVECRLETGRTHQIRVHMSWQGHPLFNDERYGGDRILKGTTFSKYRQFVENCFAVLPRHALHARSLGFVHPTTRETVYFESELPSDFRALLEKWETYAAASKETDNG